jgi:CBS domain-containing protein
MRLMPFPGRKLAASCGKGGDAVYAAAGTMKVEDIMNTTPATCLKHESLRDAVRVMRENDCGWVPVVSKANKVVGVITDRDVCMAAYATDARLGDIAIEGAMSTNVRSCHPDDRLENAEALMRNYRVRRLAVVNEEDELVGLLSLSDMARRAKIDGATQAHGLNGDAVAATLAAICEPRSASSAV